MARAGTTFSLAHVCVSLALMAGVVSACEKAKAPAPAAKAPEAAEQKAAATAPAKPSADFSGVVRGIVKLAPDATLPMVPAPAKAPANAAPPCRPYGEDDRRIVSKFEGTGGLTPIHLAVTQMKAVPEHKPQTHDVFIRNCRLTPALVGAMLGDELRITNESDQPFMPVFPGDPFMRGLMKGESRTIKLERIGPARVACGFAGYCGETTILTVAHPLFTVTNERGEFEIRGIPLDQDIAVHAGHMLFEVSTLKTRLTKAEPEKVLEFVLTPATPSGTKPFEVKDADKAKTPGDSAPAQDQGADKLPAKGKAEGKAPGKGSKGKAPEPPPSVIK